MKALIKVGYGCNENCTFCHTLNERHIDGTAEDAAAKIHRAKELGYSMVVLSGGEPTIRPELFAWTKLIASLDMDVGLVTNGRIFAYEEVTARLLATRMKYVYMSLHGGEARVHESLVRTKGSFADAQKAIANLTGKGLDFTLNCVVTQQNVDHLVGVVDLVLPYPDVVLKFSMVQPKGGGDRLFEHLAPKVSHVARRVCEAIEHGLARAGADGPRFAHDGVPLCLLPGHEQRYDDLKTHRFATMIETWEPDFYPVDDAAKVLPAPCEGCALRGPCPGLYRGYHEVFGHDELRPVRERPRANSFHYVLEKVVADGVTNGHCPLRDGALGISPWDRVRTLHVQHEGRIARYRTETRDFADDELVEVKHARGQLYLDATRKDAPDDFARDLVPLRRSATCDGCPEHDRCTGLFTPLFSDLFTRDDARVRELLGELTGRVLDIGCGEAPYADVLATRRDAIEYVGLDPNPALLSSLASRLPWGTFRTGAAEDLLPELFDHVLALRSWNHLVDPPRVLAKLHAALRPGGTLLVVDDVAFGLARTRPQASRAERSTAQQEHRRNDGPDEAARAIAAAGFTVTEKRDVSPTTSTLWLIRAERGHSPT